MLTERKKLLLREAFLDGKELPLAAHEAGVIFDVAHNYWQSLRLEPDFSELQARREHAIDELTDYSP